MKACILSALVFLSAIPQLAEARIGENYRQCVARYGNSFTNFPGLTHLLGVAIFEKDGINVTVAFDRPNRQGFLVLYTNGRFLTIDERNHASDLKDNEIESLMSSLNVSWDSPDYEPPKPSAPPPSRIDPSMRTLAGPRKVGSSAPPPAQKQHKTNNAQKPPKWTENLDLAKTAVKNFLEAITLEDPNHRFSSLKFRKIGIAYSGGARIVDQYKVNAYRRSGDHLFAFQLIADGKCFGLIFINSDAAKAISGWATAYVKSHDNPPPKDKGRKLEGF